MVANFVVAHFGPTPPTGKPLLVVHPVRKDGKFKVEYCFTGKTITKIITADTLHAERDTGHYDIRLT